MYSQFIPLILFLGFGVLLVLLFGLRKCLHKWCCASVDADKD